MDRYLRQRVENEIAAANNPDLPVETRQNAAAAAKDIGNFLRLMGVPQEAVPQGVSPDDWEFMTPEERALWQ